MKFLSLNVQEAIITPPEEEPMCEDPLEVALDELKDQVSMTRSPGLILNQEKLTPQQLVLRAGSS